MKYLMMVLEWLKTAVSWVTGFAKDHGASVAVVTTVIGDPNMSNADKAKAIASVVFAEIAKEVLSILSDPNKTQEQKTAEISKALPDCVKCATPEPAPAQPGVGTTTETK